MNLGNLKRVISRLPDDAETITNEYGEEGKVVSADYDEERNALILEVEPNDEY